MADLPEDREEEEQKLQEDKAEKSIRRYYFGEGFVTGMLAALVCVLAFFTAARFAGRYFPGSRGDAQKGAEILTSQETADKLEEIQRLIQSRYLDEVDGETLSDGLFRGVAAGLGDAYSRYYTSEELDSVRQSSEGAYYGIGATLSQNAQTGEILVSAVYEGSPAEQGGLRQGDYLLAVGEVPVSGMDLSDVITWIREQEDVFTLTVLRQEEEQTLELACGQVEKSTVAYEMTDFGIGYIRITEFDAVTVAQFEAAVQELLGQHASGLIFDVRDNPGGLLESVCDILDYLLPEGLIVYTEDRDGDREEYASDADHYVDCPMAVLVNGNSASASEIFAGALQDYGLGTVIGTPTYGKGVVQNTYVLSDGSAFKMTIEKYYTPAGQDIDGNGITPDLIVEETEGSDAPMEQALEVLGYEGTEDHLSGTAD